MKLFKNKEDKKLYTIEHLIHDIHHLNNNEFAGIYAYPFDWQGEVIVFRSKIVSECENYVKENFYVVAHY